MQKSFGKWSEEGADAVQVDEFRRSRIGRSDFAFDLKFLVLHPLLVSLAVFRGALDVVGEGRVHQDHVHVLEVRQLVRGQAKCRNIRLLHMADEVQLLFAANGFRQQIHAP